MEIRETLPIAEADLPWVDCAEYLRLRRDANGTLHQPGPLAGAMRAAIASIEAQTGRYLLPRQLELVTQSLPAELPIARDDAPTVIEAMRGMDLVETGAFSWQFQRGHSILNVGGPRSGEWLVILRAGREWDALPADLRLAVQILTAHNFAGQADAPRTRPSADLAVLLARYRPMRILRG